MEIITMINSISGVIREITPTAVVLATGPIGFDIQVPSSQSFNIGKTVTLYTHLHWNMEKGPNLYGFLSTIEKEVFLIITSCSGLGPRIALAALSDLGATGFLTAIQMGNEEMLNKVNGIGAKKAEQMIVQLKHKVAKLVTSGVDFGNAKQLISWHEVTQALESLNYSRMEINRTMNHLKKSTKETDISFDKLLRKALTCLSKQR